MTSIEDRALEKRHAAEPPENPFKALHEFGLQSRLRVIFSHEVRAEPLEIIGALPNNDQHLRGESVLPGVKARARFTRLGLWAGAPLYNNIKDYNY
jgi:hypothetical protein